MANITTKDLNINTTGVNLLNDSMGFIQDISEDELSLQGGCGKTFTIRLPNGRVIIGRDMCSPLLPNTPFSF